MTDLSQCQLHGFLQCELDGSGFSMSFTGRSIVVNVSHMATGLKLLQLGLPPGSYLRSIRRLQKLLDSTCMNLEFRLREKPMGTVGHNQRTAWGKLFGLPALSLSLVAIAAACVRESRQEIHSTKP
ncbi:hypothetical protein Mal52_59990 [Symmachiella dynata]|uniref:Uncharacterized protein n=1 Tax=Symmachiella dynata TaxID=2527995 RepID=A0A517ZYB5_9PLAN|nr:hypothetical protein Mal52_59990 [Symmachiella dynata]